MDDTHFINNEFTVTIKSNDSALISVYAVTKTLAAVDSVLLARERSIIDNIASDIPEISRVTIDAIKQRMNSYRGKTLQLSRLENGSLIFIGVCGGVALWLIQSTLGETLKEAWLTSEAHKKLLNLLSKPIKINTKVISDSIVKAIKSGLKRADIYSHVEASIDRSSFNAIRFSITVVLRDESLPPTPAKLKIPLTGPDTHQSLSNSPPIMINSSKQILKRIYPEEIAKHMFDDEEEEKERGQQGFETA